jgi:hypothetical protein
MMVEPRATPRAGGPRSQAASRSWRVAAAVATIGALLLGGVALWSWLAGENTVSVKDEFRTYQHAVSRVELDLFSGQVAVAAGRSDQVVVERRLQWKGTQPTYKEEWRGDVLRITVECPGDHESCGIDYTLRVPAGVSLGAHSGSGDMTVRDLTGEVRLDTGSGEVTIHNVSGKLWIRSGAGDVEATRLRSQDTDIDTGSGRVDLRYLDPVSTARVVTGSGEIRVSVPDGGFEDGYNVRADTGSGKREVGVRVDSASRRTITVSTGSGDITVDNT